MADEKIKPLEILKLQLNECQLKVVEWTKTPETPEEKGETYRKASLSFYDKKLKGFVKTNLVESDLKLLEEKLFEIRKALKNKEA